MADIKGKNSLTGRKIFANRALYSLLAFAPDQDPALAGLDSIVPPGTRNFWWAEDGFYGKLSSNDVSEPIEPQELLMKSLRSKKSSIRVMNFVADAFVAFQKQFLLDIRKGNFGLLADDPMLSEISAVKGYQSVSRSYRNYQKNNLRVFIRYINSNDIAKNILNMDDFLEELAHYIMQVHRSPFTRSGFIMSRYVSPLMSGLCIEIKNLPYSKDEKKIEFINSPNFKHYIQLANQFGFMIDKNIPWRLIADLSIPKTVEYAQVYNSEVEDIDGIIKNFYTQVADTEIENLKLYLVGMYNQFVIENPTSLVETHSHSKTTRVVNTRSKMTLEDLNSCYSDCKWLELYIKVRNMETGLNYSTPAIDAITRVAKDKQKTLDTVAAMGYIKDKFSGVEFYEGSLSHTTERNRQASSGKEELTPDEVVKANSRSIRKVFF
tara:strand:+ start:1404 stop:2708 length:1305 start_codon:yes stop_codon:yes gene_type:complete